MDAFSEKAGIPIYCGEHGWSTANPPTYCNYTKQPSQNGWGAGDNFTDYSTEEYAAQYHKAVFEAGMNDEDNIFMFQIIDHAERAAKEPQQANWGLFYANLTMKPLYYSLDVSNGGEQIVLPEQYQPGGKGNTVPPSGKSAATMVSVPGVLVQLFICGLTVLL